MALVDYITITRSDGQEVQRRSEVFAVSSARADTKGDGSTVRTEFTSDNTRQIRVIHELITSSERDQIRDWYNTNRSNQIEIEANDGETYICVFADRALSVRVAEGQRFTLTLNMLGNLPAAPSVVTDFTTDNTTLGQIAYTWEEPRLNGSTVTDWKLRWRSGNQSFGAVSREIDVGSDTRAYTLTGLTGGVRYYVQVQPVVSGVTTVWSRTVDEIAVDVPEATIANGQLEGTNVRITWNENDTDDFAAKTYDVYRNTGTSVDTGDTRVATDLTDLQYLDSNTSLNTTYSYIVIVKNEFGSSVASNTVTQVIPATEPQEDVNISNPESYSAVSQSSSLFAGAGESNGIVYNFTVPTGLGGEWCVMINYTPTTLGLHIVSGTNTSTQTGSGQQSLTLDVNAAQDVSFTVYADTQDDIDNIGTLTLTLMQPVIPAIPSRIALRHSVQNNTIRLSWNSPSYNNGEPEPTEIQHRLASETTWTDSGTTTGTSFNITGLDYNTAYRVRARAVNSVGNGTYSNVISATTPEVRPPVIRIADIDRVDSLVANFTLSVVEFRGITQYSTDSGTDGWQIIAEISNGGTESNPTWEEVLGSPLSTENYNNGNLTFDEMPSDTEATNYVNRLVRFTSYKYFGGTQSLPYRVIYDAVTDSILD